MKNKDKATTIERSLINRIIELLENEPELFSPNWFNKDSLDHSVKYKKILVFKNGEIIQPDLANEMSKKDIQRSKTAVERIRNKFKEKMIDNILKELEK